MKPRRLLSRTRKPFAVIFIVGFFLFVSLALKSIFAALAASPEAGVSVVAVAPRAAALQAVNTLLELRFENGSLNGAQGETPTQSSGITAQAGINGQGLYMDRGNRLTYPSELNINSTEGTIELWMKPSWNGNDGQNHAILRYGLSGSYMFLGKEGNNLRLALNRASDNGSLELDVFTNIQNWQADQWHHVAAVWSNAGQFLRLYVDGMLASERSISATLPTISSVLNPTLQIGGDSVRSPLLATIDNVLISDGVRSAQEIATHMLEGLTISAVTISPSITSLDLYSGWTYWQDFKYTVTTPVGSLTLPWLVGSVNSSAAGTATTDSISGRIKAGATTGTATFTANFSGLQTVITVNVLTPKKAMETDVIDTYLSTPRTGALYKIPVAIIRYLPAKNATDLDDAITGFASTLAAQRTKQIDVEKKLKFMLEEGSRFRGYKTSGATASLGYQVVKIINVYEDVPPGLPTGTTGVYFPDYKQIFSRHNVKDLIMNQGVKEIWFEQYVNGRLALDESNLASSLTGDISKSLRTNDDLPVYSKSYTLFGINIAQAENNAARSHGHHLEALLTYANMLQDGDDTLFQEQFIGRAVDGSFAQGRVGKTDRPPNSASDFDFNNTTEVDSDMQDWFPDGHGTHELISRDAWANLVYSWPVTPTGKTEGQWYLFWMQLHPGLNNGITRLETERLTNWWRFTADWDAAMQVKLGLVEPLSCQYALSSTSRNVSGNGVSASVNVTCGANCKWTATTNETWIKLTTATGTGNGAVNFTVDPTSVARTGTIVIADQLFTINQSNCTFTLTPATQNIPATSGTATLAVTVAGAASCPWTATSDSAWLTVATGGSGTGNGTITFNVAANTSVARTATVTVADQTVTITQNSGCVFTLVPTSRTVSALGGTDSLNVQTGTGCPWTAISNDSWLQITAGSSGTGNGTVSLTIAANSGPQRNGTLNVSGQTYTVTQTAANPLPTLTGLNPTSINAGNAAFNLTVTGTNFVNTSVVNWNGSLRVTTFVNATQLTAAITAADVAATGTASVTVTSPAPGGGTTGALNFAINNPAPTLTSISPTSTTAGGAGLTLTLNGTNFNAASVAQVNGSNRTTTFVSGTQLTISLTSSDVANAGTLTVVVVNPAPGGGTSGQQTFTINNPAPTLTSLSQNTVTAGNGAFTLTVNGTNFVSGSKVRWNGADRTTTFVSSTQLSASITAADVAAAGTGNVTVFNAAPGGGTSSALSLTITAPCSYALTASNQNFTTAGGAGGVTLNTARAARGR
ncbi:MAG: BACON domain-containing carbohydrate-binding protein [Blastocatellia bacterium]